MPKREKEAVIYIRTEQAVKNQLQEAAKNWDMNLASYCRMVLIQSLKK